MMSYVIENKIIKGRNLKIYNNNNNNKTTTNNKLIIKIKLSLHWCWFQTLKIVYTIIYIYFDQITFEKCQVV